MTPDEVAAMPLDEFGRRRVVVEFSVPYHDETLYLVPTKALGRSLKLPRHRSITVAEARAMRGLGRDEARAVLEAKLLFRGSVRGAGPDSGDAAPAARFRERVISAVERSLANGPPEQNDPEQIPLLTGSH